MPLSYEMAGSAAPDPFKPAYLYPAGSEPREAGRRWVQHRERRAQINAMARRLLAEKGIAGISLREIADRCGVSLPTVYNVVGQRMDVLGASSTEWVRWLAVAAGRRYPSVCEPVSMLFAFWASAFEHPDYTARAVESCFAPGSPLNHAFMRPGIEILRESLIRSIGPEGFRANVDIAVFTRQLALLVHSDLCAWVMEPYSTDLYRRAFASGPGMMLLGAVRGAACEMVEQALDQVLVMPIYRNAS